ncbi:AAA domain-containing protein [Fusarium flagelliforme]|nr:AAA domain-containing protein [Fusarium flagelliforme]KAH7174564.1 AAA domain-containing protein [Fusarium flagelliforme]
MLDTQYRMHPQLCEFPSNEFYDGNLKSGISMPDRQLGACDFPFPKITGAGGQNTRAHDNVRAIFINCDSTEMPGQKSKENRGQAELCTQVCRLLITSPSQEDSGHSIVVLTPYTRQADALKRMLPSISQKIEVCSIDGFQGREADIIIFVTVRCNAHREIGFLKDVRRVNVALTRARSALIVIGNRATLTGGPADEESSKMWERLLGVLTEVKLEVPVSA